MVEQPFKNPNCDKEMKLSTKTIILLYNSQAKTKGDNLEVRLAYN